MLRAQFLQPVTQWKVQMNELNMICIKSVRSQNLAAAHTESFPMTQLCLGMSSTIKTSSVKYSRWDYQQSLSSTSLHLNSHIFLSSLILILCCFICNSNYDCTEKLLSFPLCYSALYCIKKKVEQITFAQEALFWFNFTFVPYYRILSNPILSFFFFTLTYPALFHLIRSLLTYDSCYHLP